MSKENYNITVDGDTKTLTILEGDALPLSHPQSVFLNGVINTPRKFIEMRRDTFDHLASYIRVDRSQMAITLVVNEQARHGTYVVTGSLEHHPDFEKWGINTGQDRTPKELAEFIKMNRASFDSIETAMKLVTELSSLKVKVQREAEKADNNRGDYKSMVAQNVIKSNIPEEFTLLLPIFKGEAPKLIKCEVYINPDTFGVKLVSPEANDITASVKDNIIDNELTGIQAIAPSILIFES